MDYSRGEESQVEEVRSVSLNVKLLFVAMAFDVWQVHLFFTTTLEIQLSWVSACDDVKFRTKWRLT